LPAALRGDRSSFRTVNYGWEQLAKGVHRARLPFLDVTVGVVRGSAGVLLVDTGTTLAEAAAIDADVRALTTQRVTHIVLTHYHFDHILGSPQFEAAAVYAAPQVAHAMTARAAWLRADALRHGAEPNQVDRAIAALRPPDHQVWEALIDLGDRIATVSHPGPGHTGHDLTVAVTPIDPVDPPVVFCGDLVEESGDPAVDTDSDTKAWPATLDRVLQAGGPDAIFVPGHGAVVGADFIRGQQDWLRAYPREAGPAACTQRN
jgi:glyoxylase-like metal-dependent hydrolase (beta-lactamase superfamily II)